jgi:biopolymer transport protein ExbD/biopolymer transport protein TolR
MRRFSQRSHLVTLSEINITPLLDLAFVLLIIFVITTPMLDQGLGVNLPSGGRLDRPLDRNDIRTVNVGRDGVYKLAGQPMTLPQLQNELVRTFRTNPNLVVYIRADKTVPWEKVFALTDMLSNRGITRYNFRSEPPPSR